jgi:hypothetical protein
MEEHAIYIRQFLKESRDRQKIHVDAHRIDRSYKVGDRVVIHIRPNKSIIQFEKGTKLLPQFIRPFEIRERIGPVAYCLVLPSHLHKIHDVFHVSILQH